VKLENCQQAQDYVFRILRGKGFEIIRHKPVNYVEKYRKFTHCVIVVEKKGVKSALYMLFKRKFFLTYGKRFDDSGFGESINVDCFKQLEKSKTLEKILFVYPDGTVLFASPDSWREFIEKNSTVRLTRATGEATTSVRLDVLDRWDRDMTVQDLELWLEKKSVYGSVRKMLKNAVGRLKKRFEGWNGG